MFLIRGIVFTHEAVRDWEAKLAPLLAVRKRRAGKAGRCWHVDETYVKVAGEWCYLYRAIDRDGTLVDVYLSATRDMAKAFLRSGRSVTQIEPSTRSATSCAWPATLTRTSRSPVGVSSTGSAWPRCG